MHCREILFTPRCSTRVREFPRSVNFLCETLLRRYGASKLPIFRILAYFPHTKRLTKRGLYRLPSGYIAEWLRFFHVIVEGSKGCLLATEFFSDFWKASWGPPNLLKFSPMANGYTDTECYTTRRVRSGPKMSRKGAILRMGVFSATTRLRYKHFSARWRPGVQGP